jgi:hypothetical protein
MKIIIKTILIMLGYLIILPIIVLAAAIYFFCVLTAFAFIVCAPEMFHDIYLELEKKEKIK